MMTLPSEVIKAKSIPMSPLSIIPSQSSHSFDNFNPSALAQPLPIKHRKKFSPEEDEILSEMVEKFGPKKWNRIAQYLPFRTARQCRDRYCNYLAPGFFNGEWLQEEDDLLYEKYKEIGPKWAQMKVFFKNRSPNSLKNRWNYFVSKMHPSVQSPEQLSEQSPVESEANIKIDETKSSKKEDSNSNEFSLVSDGFSQSTDKKNSISINLKDNLSSDNFKVYYDIYINPQNINYEYLSNNITELKRTNFTDDFDEIYTFPSLAQTPMIPVHAEEPESYDLSALSFDLESPVPF